MHLTKSLFVDFMDYPKLARWKANNPTVYKKIRKIETEEQEDHIMAIGQAVEDVVKTYLEQRYNTTALDLMPRRHKLKDEESDDDDEVFVKAELDLPTALADTIKAIRDHIPVLYQPTFQYGECLVRADFMVRNGSSYDLYEAKAKSGIRKDITDDGEKKPL
jgi:predicted RecB family nuclease